MRHRGFRWFISSWKGPADSISRKLWAAGVLVMCTNQFILGGPGKGEKQIKSGMQDLFSSPGSCSFPLAARGKQKGFYDGVT